MPQIQWRTLALTRCTGCDRPLAEVDATVERIVTDWDHPDGPRTWFERYCRPCYDRMRESR